MLVKLYALTLTNFFSIKIFYVIDFIELPFFVGGIFVCIPRSTISCYIRIILQVPPSRLAWHSAPRHTGLWTDCAKQTAYVAS